MNEITQEIVRELFEYKNGKLFWKIRRSGIKLGDRAGHLRSDGYRRTQINGKHYYEHRLIWLYHKGFLPKYLDHINRIRDDNQIDNLREATNAQNMMNMKKKKENSTSKYKGVSLFKPNNKWTSQIMKDGETIYLGRFNTEEEAALSYNKKAVELFGEFAMLNIIRNY